MKRTNETVGFIGFGNMGQFMAERMFPDSEIVAHDPNIHERRVNGTPMVPLTEAAMQQTVVVAVPPRAHRGRLGFDLAKHVSKTDTLLVDTSSVKERADTFLSALGFGEQLLSCHHLFGPQTAHGSLRGHRLFVTHENGDKSAQLLERWRGLGLNILRISAADHDRTMAATQGVPTVLGWLASRGGFDDPKKFQTPSRLATRQLAEFAETHSPSLLETLAIDNPHMGPILDQMAADIDTLRRRHATSPIAQTPSIPSTRYLRQQ